jgi:hypothetical protein
MAKNPVMFHTKLELPTMRGEKKIDSAAEVVDDSIDDDGNTDEIEILIDEESGRSYSWDSKTDVTAWLDEDTDEEAGGENSDGVWEKFQDSEGDWYECNSITEETRWIEDLDEDSFEVYER